MYLCAPRIRYFTEFLAEHTRFPHKDNQAWVSRLVALDEEDNALSEGLYCLAHSIKNNSNSKNNDSPLLLPLLLLLPLPQLSEINFFNVFKNCNKAPLGNNNSNSTNTSNIIMAINLFLINKFLMIMINSNTTNCNITTTATTATTKAGDRITIVVDQVVGVDVVAEEAEAIKCT
jgi:hypothetical protein